MQEEAMSSLEFTGERFHPELNGEIRQEHMHRYAWCRELAEGKDVIDVASGEGFGSAMLKLSTTWPKVPGDITVTISTGSTTRLCLTLQS